MKFEQLYTERFNLIKCVSFDFDRTLVHVTPLTQKLIPELLAIKGIHISEEDFYKKNIQLRTNMPEHLRERFRLFGTLPKNEREFFIREYNRARIDSLKIDDTNKEEITNWVIDEISRRQKKVIYPDVKETIKKLNLKQIKQYILSGNHSDGIIELLQEENLIDFFHKIITVDKYESLKNNNFKYLIKYSKLKPQEILHIGDDFKTDGMGAKKYNINTLIIHRSGQFIYDQVNKEKFQIINKLSDLFDFI